VNTLQNKREVPKKKGENCESAKEKIQLETFQPYT